MSNRVAVLVLGLAVVVAAGLHILGNPELGAVVVAVGLFVLSSFWARPRGMDENKRDLRTAGGVLILAAVFYAAVKRYDVPLSVILDLIQIGLLLVLVLRVGQITKLFLAVLDGKREVSVSRGNYPK